MPIMSGFALVSGVSSEVVAVLSEDVSKPPSKSPSGMLVSARWKSFLMSR